MEINRFADMSEEEFTGFLATFDVSFPRENHAVNMLWYMLHKHDPEKFSGQVMMGFANLGLGVAFRELFDYRYVDWRMVRSGRSLKVEDSSRQVKFIPRR